MSSDAHNTFQGVAAMQDYDLDSVIKRLDGLRTSHFNRLRGDHESAASAMNNETDVDRGMPFLNAARDFVTYHRAYLVATTLKDNGHETVTLNDKQNLGHQLIASVSRDLLEQAGIKPMAQTDHRAELKRKPA